ncbi:MAG: hypothetical protein V8R27_00190 [Oscillospiraceae bacterium]
MLQVHTRNIELAEDVNLKKVALATAGCGRRGADLANLCQRGSPPGCPQAATS